MLPRTLDQQVRHMEWADARLWESALTLPAAGSDERLRSLLHHVHVVQHIYLQLRQGEPFSARGPGEFADLGALRAWGRGFHSAARDFLGGVGAGELERAIVLRWAADLQARFGAARTATVEESVVQVVLHSAHHRAQMCTRLRELGGEPPLVDFVAWVWMGRPAPAWPAAAA